MEDDRRSRPTGTCSSYFKERPETIQEPGGPTATAGPGSIEDGLAAADVKLDATYTVAYIAHAPLEPRAAVAEWKDGKLTVWTGTQRPFGVRGELAQAFGLPEDQVRVIVPDTGSGYGGKHTGEAAVEAARLAKAAGKPVKLVWTREEEFTWAYFRPAGVIEVKAGVAQGRHAHGLGVPQLQLRRRRASRTPYEVAEPARSQFHPARLAAAPGLVPRAGRRPPTTSPASRTWTSWPTAVEHGPAGVPPEEPEGRAAARPSSRRPRSGSAGARRSRRRAAASASPAGPRRAATSPPAPRSPSTGRAARCGSCGS